jgi:hypothetical protein
MVERPPIPIALERAVKIEAGHRCAIPTCKHPRVEIAHIVPWAEVQEHTFENLIALCPNCHDLYDKDKKIDRRSMLTYKANLGLLNSRYGEFERRVLQQFSEQPQAKIIRLPGSAAILVLYLLKDGFLLKTNEGPHINGSPSWEEYTLTAEGRQFVDNWKEARSLE